MPTKTASIEERYKRATDFLPWRLVPRLKNVEIIPHWIGNKNSFWYIRDTHLGKEFIVVDAETGRKEPAFDHKKVAGVLADIIKSQVSEHALPFEFFCYNKQGGIDIDLPTSRLSLGPDYQVCRIDHLSTSPQGAVAAPDSCVTVSRRDENLWLCDLKTDDWTPLTNDGCMYYGYGKSPDYNTYTIALRSCGVPLPTIALWSPDSTYIFTHRLDERKLESFHLIQSVRSDGGLRPLLHSYKYPLPGEQLALCTPVVINRHTRKAIYSNLDPVEISDYTPIEWMRAWWSPDARTVYYVTASRDKRTLKLMSMCALSGETKCILEDRSEMYLSLTPGTPRVGNEGRPNVRFIWENNELIWYSERDQSGSLYLYDLSSGKIKNRITDGGFLVRDIIHVDDAQRLIYFTASGREKGRDPYCRHFYVVNFDGSKLRLLTPEDAEHNIYVPPPNALMRNSLFLESGRGFSPSGHYFVDTHGRADKSPKALLRRTSDGQEVLCLETMDDTPLTQNGWRWPDVFSVKAADGHTDLYGVIWRPSWHNGREKLPIIDIVYPGPQITITPKTSFKSGFRSCFAYTFCQSLAELGFAVVMLDARGTALRSNEFKRHSYGNLGGTTQQDDHVAAIRALKDLYPELDIDRVGIHGHSGGGYATVRAMLMYPDFFKVGVASAGCHDLESLFAMWCETYQGLPENAAYERLDNAEFAGALKGKLLLAYSDMDENVHFSSTIRLMDAFIKNNKDFDLLILPNAGHDFAATNYYFLRKVWDYFTLHLLNECPPQGFSFPS